MPAASRPPRRTPSGREQAALFALALALAAACAGSRPSGATPSAPALDRPVATPAATAPPVDPQARYGPDPAAALSAVEEDALDVARARLSAGAEKPRASGALTRAARALARRSASGAPGVADLATLRAALAEGLAADPAPTQYLFEGDRAGLRASLAALLPRGAPATHVGVGAIEASGTVHLVVLTSVRRARLDPFPRDVSPGSSAVLSGALAAGLRAARVVLTLPSGAVSEAATTGDGGAFRAPLRFAERGRYLVEVIAQGPDGPTVAALLAVRAGGGPLRAPDAGASAPTSPSADPEAQVIAAIDALRARRGLGRLQRSAALDGVARRHSEAMRQAGRMAHALPGEPPTGERVRAAGVAFRQVRENVARGDSALGAHEAAVESPAHLENLVDPAVTLVGVGVAVARDATAGVFLTEVFVQPAAEDDGPLTLDARVRDALWRERARLALPPLTADPFLDEIARRGAAALRDADADPRARPDLEGEALARRKLAGGDVYVATSPDEATRSRNLPDPRYRRVGVGAIQAASRRFGPGRLFIAVVYSD